MKKIRYPVFVIVFLLALSLSGCLGSLRTAELGEVTVLSRTYDFSYNDTGVVFGTQFSWFFDPASGLSAPLCTRVNCTHDSLDCDAARSGMLHNCAAIVGEHLYYVDCPQLGIVDFYRADVDGTNRKRLQRAEDVMTCWYGSYEGGYLIYCYENRQDENGEFVDEAVTGICLLDLKNGELARIEMPAAYSARIYAATIDGGMLYFAYYYGLKPWKDFSEEEILSNAVSGQMRSEMWKYDLSSGEKSMVWQRKFAETDQVQLGYGHLYIDASAFGGGVSMEELSTGDTYALEREEDMGKMALLTDEGVLLVGDGEFSMWRFDSGELASLGTMEKGTIYLPEAVTGHWVYAKRFCNGEFEGFFYAPRDGFMKGEADWKLIPGTGQEKPQMTGTDSEVGQEPFVSEFADYPDDYFVKWAVWGGIGFVEISPQTLEEINRKLKEDGYGFGLKILYVEDTGNVEDLAASGADIASTGIVFADGYLYAARDMFEKQLFEPLEGRLEGSRLYDAIPRLCWEKVRYQGTIYSIPSEDIDDRRCYLLLNPKRALEGLPEQFGGNLYELDNYLSEECPMYYDADFSFAEAFGYAFDLKGGVLIREDGTMVNPLDEEPVVEWLRTVNRWYQEGKLQADSEKINQCSLAFVRRMRLDGYQEYASWAGYVYHNVDYSTGILAGSQKKDEAFALLELFHTDHSYGDLLIYGRENLDQKPERGFTSQQAVYGLATGLKWGEDLIMPYFATAEEKKRYYDEHLMPSPCLYTEFPNEGQKLYRIEEYYLHELITCDDFDAMLQEFRDAIGELVETVLGKLAA